MAWITITAARLAAKTAELASVKGVLVPTGQTADDIIAEELESTAKLVRGYCPPSCELGTGSTIPDELEDDALAIVRLKVFERIAALQRYVTDSRKEAATRAERRLEAWARGGFRVIPPTTAAQEQAAGPSVSRNPRTPRRLASREALDGA